MIGGVSFFFIELNMDIMYVQIKNYFQHNSAFQNSKDLIFFYLIFYVICQFDILTKKEELFILV